MKKIILLLFLNMVFMFLGGMEADLSQEVRIQTFTGQITTIPQALARCSCTLFSESNKNKDLHTLPPGIDVKHVECLKGLFKIIDQGNQDETTLLDTLRKHYNSQAFNDFDKSALQTLIKDLHIIIPERHAILKKMFQFLKIESNDGRKALYIHPKRFINSEVLSTMVDYVSHCHGDELITEGIPFELFDGVHLLFAGNSNQTNDIGTIIESLYINQLFEINQETNFYIERLMLLIKNALHDQDVKDLCKQFDCLKKDELLGSERAAMILQKIKDNFYTMYLTGDMRSRIEFTPTENKNYEDTFSISIDEGGYYGSQEKTITVKRKDNGAVIVDHMLFSGEYVFSPDNRFLFVVKKDEGSGVMIDCLTGTERFILTAFPLFCTKICFSPNSKILAIVEGIPQGFAHGLLELALVLVSTDTGLELARMNIDSVGEFTKNSHYMVIKNLDKKQVLLNLALLHAFTLEEGLAALYEEPYEKEM